MVKSFSEFLSEIENGEYEYKCSPKRLYDIITSTVYGNIRRKYDFFEKNKYFVLGISDVTENIVHALFDAYKFMEKNNQILLITFIGPTGSGKSEIKRALDYGLEEYMLKEKAYKIIIDNEVCPVADDPIAIFSSYFLNKAVIEKNEEKIKSIINKFRGKAKLCTYCEERMEKILREGEGSLLDILEKNISIVPLEPRYAFIEFSNKDFRKIFPDLVVSCNRGILHIEFDDIVIKDIEDQIKDEIMENYQILLKLRDMELRTKDAKTIHPDITVFLYGNLELANVMKRKNTPLADSTYIINVHRVLSFSAEKEIYKRVLDFEHTSPHALTALSKFIVSTRINSNKESEIKSLLTIYDRFEMDSKLKGEEIEEIKNRLLNVVSPEDGWEDGISLRSMVKIIYKDISKNKKCLSPKIVLKFIEKYKEESKIYISIIKEMIKNIKKDVILSFILIENNLNDIIDIEELLKNYITEMFSKKRDEKKMENIRRKLKINNKEEFERVINEYIERSDAEEWPDFNYILEQADVVGIDDNIKSYINWRHFLDGNMDKEDKEKLKNIIEKLKKLGYCDTCSNEALQLFARGVKNDK